MKQPNTSDLERVSEQGDAEVGAGWWRIPKGHLFVISILQFYADSQQR
jgi:hypothetical protein